MSKEELLEQIKEALPNANEYALEQIYEFLQSEEY